MNTRSSTERRGLLRQSLLPLSRHGHSGVIRKRPGAGSLKAELNRGAAANPFLASFYLEESPLVEPEHIGIVYASVRAGLALGDTATLSLDAGDDRAGEDQLSADLEISVMRRDASEPHTLNLETHLAGSIVLGGQVEDADVVVPHTRIEVGVGHEAVFIAPVNIECGELVVSANTVIVEAPYDQHDHSVFLRAGTYEGHGMSDVPVVRGDVTLSACWPGAVQYPWNAFASEPPPSLDDPNLEEALRRFRRFVIAFRSHKNSGLARYMGQNRAHTYDERLRVESLAAHG